MEVAEVVTLVVLWTVFFLFIVWGITVIFLSCCSLYTEVKEEKKRRRRNARLVITSITADNFKSYIGRQQIGPFHQNVALIKGPNDGGKSNVMDALLFVIGHRASEIRYEKMSDLIHSSNGRENLQSCSVSVNFLKIVDKGNGFKVVHGSSFVVSRTAYHDNSSNYTYNGKTIHFEELAGKLRQVGIDLIHNRFLIHQGEVERIALMKPKAQTEGEEGMLEYLENIIGSNRLKQPMEELHVSIEKLQGEISAQSEGVKAAEEEKNGLEGQVKEYRDYMKLENKITRVRNKIHQLEKHKIAVERDELQQRIGKYQEDLNRVTQELDKVLEKQNANKEQQNKLRKDYDEALKNEAEKTKRWTEMEPSEQKQILEPKTKLEVDVKAEQEKEQNGASTAEGNLNEAQMNLQNDEADLEEGNEQIAPLVTNIEKLTEEGQLVLDEGHDAQQESINKERLLEEESKMNAELNDVKIELQLEKDKRRWKLEELTAASDAMNAQIKKIDKSISKLKLNGDLDGIIRINGGHSATNEHVDFLDETADHTSVLNAARSSTESGRISAPLNNQSDDEEGARNPNEAEQLKTYGAAVIATWDSDALAIQLDNLEKQETGQKAPDQAIVEEYKEKVRDSLTVLICQADKHERLIAELEAITFERDRQQNYLDKLTKRRLKEFRNGFAKIESALEEAYQVITGGTASLNLIDPLNPFSGGISFYVRPPKKSWKQIANLSGGEKALSSWALVFALRAYKSTPLYVVDEIDAALDFRNVAHYFNNLARNVQFIIISLPNNMVEQGDRLVGINQAPDCTYNVVIDPGRICLGIDENERPADTAHSSQNPAASEENAANV